MKKNICALILSAVILALTGCIQKEYTETFFAMDTPMTVTCYGENSKKAADEAKTYIKMMDEKLSRTGEQSDVYAVNNATCEQVWDVTAGIIRKSYEYSAFTDGFFDITVGNLKDLWNIEGENPTVPDENSIKEALKTVSYKNITAEAGVVYTTGECNIDLGAIAKGYASDAAADILEKNGVKNGLINLGGNIYAKGKNNNAPWKIGIRDPRGGENDIVGYVEAEDKAVVTSGDYQRFFEKDGKRYCHIINPKTGQSVDNDLMSVTIVGENGAKADALSTAVFVMGYEKGFEFCTENNISAVFIRKDRVISVSGDLAGSFKLTGESYRYEN